MAGHYFNTIENNVTGKPVANAVIEVLTSANALPRGWTVSTSGTGIYTVTHNLGIAGTQYSVTATPLGTPNTG